MCFKIISLNLKRTIYYNQIIIKIILYRNNHDGANFKILLYGQSTFKIFLCTLTIPTSQMWLIITIHYNTRAQLLNHISIFENGEEEKLFFKLGKRKFLKIFSIIT